MDGSRCRGIRLKMLAGLAACVAGCGKPADGGPTTVRGSVSFHGHLLAGGMIVFVPDKERGTSGTVLSATVGPDGTYRLVNGDKPVPAGWYRVAIADPPEWYGTEANGTAFPSALRRPDKSGVEREVKAGKENVFDFPIELTQ